MSEYIDHAARSRSRMEKTLSNYKTGEDAGAIVVALAALNDATLALVRQHQIANLIALGSLVNRDLTHEELEEASYGALDVLLDTVQTGPDDEHVVLAPDIAADLGIKVQP